MKKNVDVEDFKKWMKSQTNSRMEHAIGSKVRSEVSNKELISKIVPEFGDLHELARDFRKRGGKLINIEGDNFLIEVNSGTFYLNKEYI